MASELRSRTVVFVIALVLMVATPALRYLAGDEARFGWQMFSYAESPPTFTVITQSNTHVPIDLDDHLAFLRVGLDLADALPPHLCRQVPDAAAVRVESGDVAWDVTC